MTFNYPDWDGPEYDPDEDPTMLDRFLEHVHEWWPAYATLGAAIVIYAVFS